MMKLFSILCLLLITLKLKGSDCCGVPTYPPIINGQLFNRIINGEPAIPNSWPWVVSIRMFQTNPINHRCGGSLISERHVVTAAHCAYGIDKNNLFIVIGSNYIDINPLPENTFQISNVYVHPFYDLKLLLNDIAIIELSRPVVFSDKIAPICLPDTSDNSTIFGKDVVVAGWGSVDGANNKSSLSYNLQQTVLRILNTQNVEKCQSYDKKNYCALDSSPKFSNVCFGDSGGPLMYYMNGKWYLYGLASFVFTTFFDKCSNINPSFYTVVPNYIDWINIVIKIISNQPTTTIKVTTIRKTTVNNPREQNQCGILSNSLSGKKSRIINGSPININQYPWIVSIREFDSTKNLYFHKCGGTLVSNKFMVTAAHCIDNNKLANLIIVIGLSNLNDPIQNDNRYQALSVIYHPDYDLKNFLNNIAIVELSRRAIIKSNPIPSICLPDNYDSAFLFDKDVTVAGWGSTTGTSKITDLSNILLFANLKIYNYQMNCQNLDSSYYCAKDSTGKNSNTCYGDSGSPLMYKIDNKWYLFGTANMNMLDNKTKACLSNYPSFYAMIPNYVSWIRKNTETI